MTARKSVLDTKFDVMFPLDRTKAATPMLFSIQKSFKVLYNRLFGTQLGSPYPFTPGSPYPFTVE